MRIDGFGIRQFDNEQALRVQNRPIGQNVQEPQVKKNDEPVSYERAAKRIETDFGGYNKFGRLNNPSSRYAVGGVADILKTDEGSVRVKMSDKGIEPEDLINPNKTAELSDEPEAKAKLTDFAISMREGIMAETGMNADELNEFVDSLRK